MSDEKHEPVAPIELVNKAHVTLMTMGHENDVIGYACGKCGMVCGKGEDGKRLAERHCLPAICECGAECSKYHTVCERCSIKRLMDRMTAAVESAEKVSIDEYDDPVVVEDSLGSAMGGRDGFFDSLSYALEEMADDDDVDPEDVFIWATKKYYFTMCASDIVQNELEAQEHYEGAEELIGSDDMQKFQEYLDGWTEQVNVVSYMVDYGRIIDGTAEVIAEMRREIQEENN